MAKIEPEIFTRNDGNVLRRYVKVEDYQTLLTRTAEPERILACVLEYSDPDRSASTSSKSMCPRTWASLHVKFHFSKSEIHSFQILMTRSLSA
jgi:hypothetical protein